MSYNAWKNQRVFDQCQRKRDYSEHPDYWRGIEDDEAIDPEEEDDAGE